MADIDMTGDESDDDSSEEEKKDKHRKSSVEAKAGASKVKRGRNKTRRAARDARSRSNSRSRSPRKRDDRSRSRSRSPHRIVESDSESESNSGSSSEEVSIEWTRAVNIQNEIKWGIGQVEKSIGVILGSIDGGLSEYSLLGSQQAETTADISSRVRGAEPLIKVTSEKEHSETNCIGALLEVMKDPRDNSKSIGPLWKLNNSGLVRWQSNGRKIAKKDFKTDVPHCIFCTVFLEILDLPHSFDYPPTAFETEVVRKGRKNVTQHKLDEHGNKILLDGARKSTFATNGATAASTSLKYGLPPKVRNNNIVLFKLYGSGNAAAGATIVKQFLGKLTRAGNSLTNAELDFALRDRSKRWQFPTGLGLGRGYCHDLLWAVVLRGISWRDHVRNGRNVADKIKGEAR